MMTPRIARETYARAASLMAKSSRVHTHKVLALTALAMVAPSLIIEPEIHHGPERAIAQRCRGTGGLDIPRQGVTAVGQK